MYQTVWLVLLALVEIIGDFAFKNYANTGLWSSLNLGIMSYVGVIFFLIRSLIGSTLLYVNGMWDAFSTLFESAAAFFILGERFADPMQYIGLGLIIFGIYFLGRGNLMKK